MFDRVLVLDEGKIVEEGPIFNLLVANSSDDEVTGKGHFAEMVRNCGPSISKEIFNLAKSRFLQIN